MEASCPWQATRYRQLSFRFLLVQSLISLVRECPRLDEHGSPGILGALLHPGANKLNHVRAAAHASTASFSVRVCVCVCVCACVFD